MDSVRENDDEDDEGVAEPLPLRELELVPSPVDGVVDAGRKETVAGDTA